MRPSVSCAELLSPINQGCSRVLTAAARAPRSCDNDSNGRPNDVVPNDVLAWMADHKITDLAALLPCNWRHAIPVARAA